MAVHEAEPESPRHAMPNEQKLCSTPDTSKRKALLGVCWFPGPSGASAVLAPRAIWASGRLGVWASGQVPLTSSAPFSLFACLSWRCRGLQIFKRCSGICPT